MYLTCMGGDWIPVSLSSSSESLPTSVRLLLSDTGSRGRRFCRPRRYSRSPSSDNEPADTQPWPRHAHVQWTHSSIHARAVTLTQSVLPCREDKVEHPWCLAVKHWGRVNGGLQRAQEGLEWKRETGVGQRRDKEVKDRLGERCRDKLLSKGCKYKLPVSRERVTGQVNTLLMSTTSCKYYNSVQFDVLCMFLHDPTLLHELLQYCVSKQSGFVWASHTHLLGQAR